MSTAESGEDSTIISHAGRADQILDTLILPLGLAASTSMMLVGLVAR